jgi:hypothetical protein
MVVDFLESYGVAARTVVMAGLTSAAAAFHEV